MYVLNTAAFNTTLVWVALLVQLYLVPPQKLSDSIVLTAVNRNQLFLFLLGNVLTGLVNKSMYTIFASPLVSFAVMTGYLLVWTIVAVELDRRNWTIKFW